MWQNVYGENGRVRDGGWTFFADKLRKEHQPSIKIELLDDDFDPIGQSIHSICQCRSYFSEASQFAPGQIQNVISDGNIDVDVDRGTRRTAELTILNPTAAFTPATEDFDPEGRWVGHVYLNRFVRIWRGLHEEGNHLYVPVGTFMVDTCEVMVEQNMSLVNLTMSDFWKKLTKSYMGSNRVYENDTPYNEIIRDFLDAAGVPRTGKYGAVLDSLGNRDPDDRRIKSKLKLSRGDSRGDKLKELAKKWNLDVYFDPLGVFRSEDRTRPKDKAKVWDFASALVDNDGRNGGLISIQRSFNDDNLYNHVIVIGTGNEKNVVRAAKADNNPRSKTNIDTIGDRVFLIESDRISTQQQANRALQRAWDKRFQLSETVVCDVICNPALEADDVIKITERDFALIDGNYRLRRFNIPLVTSRQTVEVANIIRGDDID